MARQGLSKVVGINHPLVLSLSKDGRRWFDKLTMSGCQAPFPILSAVASVRNYSSEKAGITSEAKRDNWSLNTSRGIPITDPRLIRSTPGYLASALFK